MYISQNLAVKYLWLIAALGRIACDFFDLVHNAARKIFFIWCLVQARRVIYCFDLVLSA